MIFEMGVKGKRRIADPVFAQADTLGQTCRKNGAVPGDGHVVDQSQAVEKKQILTLVVRQSSFPRGRLIAEKAMCGLVAAGRDGFREAEKVARRASQRCFRHEGSAALSAGQHAFVHEKFDGAGDGEAADGKLTRQLRLAL